MDGNKDIALVPELSGVELIAAERRRQVDEEGWTTNHDDQHDQQQLAWAAACYAAPEAIYRREDTEFGDPNGAQVRWWHPWPWSWRKPTTDRLDALIKAGALIAAEIDRLKRA